SKDIPQLPYPHKTIATTPNTHQLSLPYLRPTFLPNPQYCSQETSPIMIETITPIMQ
ncbi:hypothetical protein BB560_004539, partial [Smittium megazygosporum]